jgi:hypothetical protein
MSGRFGAAAFAERARRELQATGESVRKRTVETRDALTVQEAHVARAGSVTVHSTKVNTTASKLASGWCCASAASPVSWTGTAGLTGSICCNIFQ